MIIINRHEDREKSETLRNRFPAGDDQFRWCKHPSSLEDVACYREQGHSGPHRYFDGAKLHLWLNPDNEVTTKVLEVCIRLEVPVIQEAITET